MINEISWSEAHLAISVHWHTVSAQLKGLRAEVRLLIIENEELKKKIAELESEDETKKSKN